MALERPMPETDGLAAHYWNEASEGRLALQRCSACGRHQHYARPHCTACGSRDLAWVSASGRGHVWSHTTVHRGPYDDIAAPYVLALIRLEEGVVMLSHVVQTQPEVVSCDMKVELTFQPLREGVRLPVFRPAGVGCA
jgi:uncharacterized OB-fold protein